LAIGNESVDNGAMRLTICAPLLLLLIATTAQAQYCNPASVALILRDSKGTVLTETDVKSVAAALPKEIGDATIWVGEVSFAPDNTTVYSDTSTDFEKGRKVPALMFSNAATCTMKLTEATLEHKGQKMHLIFNIDISRETRDRHPAVDAPKFQNGTFRLDLSHWSHPEDKLIPAINWKRPKP
jgi:hypothetical protein